MSRFLSYISKVEANGQSIPLFVIGVIPQFRQNIFQILARNVTVKLVELVWFKTLNWLDSFKQIISAIGSNALFFIGKAIPDSTMLPDNIMSLKDELESINIAYHDNQWGGDNGYSRPTHFSENKRKVFMQCESPYSFPYNIGIITDIVRKFKPAGSLHHEAKLDSCKENKLYCAESNSNLINW